MPRVLIATPQQEELAPLLDRLRALGHASSRLEVGRMAYHEIPSLQAALAVAGHGKVQFALQAQYLIDRLDGIEVLVCTGAAGSLSDQVRQGDVVVATATAEHDYKLRFVPAAMPVHAGTASLVQALRDAAARGLDCRVHFGVVASGDEDIVEAERAAELRAATNGLCVAWEGSGAARVAAFNALAFVEVRGITDGADADAALAFHSNCATVMPRLAELIAEWLTPARAQAAPLPR